MELKVYEGEKFERSKKRFFIFALSILVVVVLSILYKNIVGGVLILVLAGAYVFYITKENDTIKMITGKKALQIGKSTFPYEILSGFVLEYHTKKKKIHNIVIIDKKKQSRIYTINDTAKNLENFVNELNGYIPMLDNYEQSTTDKIFRRLKL